MSDLPPTALTPRELDVAALLARRLTVKRIAGELTVGESRIYNIISAIAFKIQVPAEENDQMAVADWYRANHSSAA